MEFIKNFLVGAAKFVYGLFVAPIVAVKDVFSKTTTWAQKLIKLIDAGSRVVIIASWFFAVPAILVALAWIWFVLVIVAALIYTTILMLTSSAGLAFLMMAGAQMKKHQAEQPEVVTPVAA